MDGASKAAWRTSLRVARSDRTPDDLARAAARIGTIVLGRLGRLHTIAAYVPVRGEPGSLDLLNALHAGGTAVLLPVVDDDELDWVGYRGPDALVPARLGLREPVGPALGPAGIGRAQAVLVPALAVDETGVRLGKGHGHYDRVLARVGDGIPLVALLHDGELVPSLPSDPWDRPVTAAVSPGGGWTDLPVVEHHGC